MACFSRSLWIVSCLMYVYKKDGIKRHHFIFVVLVCGRSNRYFLRTDESLGSDVAILFTLVLVPCAQHAPEHIFLQLVVNIMPLHLEVILRNSFYVDFRQNL